MGEKEKQGQQVVMVVEMEVATGVKEMVEPPAQTLRIVSAETHVVVNQVVVQALAEKQVVGKAAAKRMMIVLVSEHVLVGHVLLNPVHRITIVAILRIEQTVGKQWDIVSYAGW